MWKSSPSNEPANVGTTGSESVPLATITPACCVVRRPSGPSAVTSQDPLAPRSTRVTSVPNAYPGRRSYADAKSWK